MERIDSIEYPAPTPLLYERSVMSPIRIASLSLAILLANSLLTMAHAEDDGAEYRRILAAAKNAKLTLVDAIKKAETRLKGVAIEAGMEAEEGLEIFVVVVNQEGLLCQS
ncbi:MAG: hypothetical protein QGF00_03530 [Planctomycetota bacterium]|jgi:hypothetical protein|nr:hypothetical protein [Planctomycetota bacterium]